jgi:outer membrane receptor protein involved in Fe transport
MTIFAQAVDQRLHNQGFGEAMGNEGRLGRRQAYAVSTAAIIWSLAAAAHAQAPERSKPGDGAASTELTEVVVTARKRPELIQQVPAAITSVDAAQLQAAHATRLDDLSGFVTNLNIVTRADNTPDVVIRGVGSFGVTPGVGFYVNDVQQFEGQSVRPEDIETVEVLKGPQGTLYGGNNIGGAIKYATKQPTSDFQAQVGIEAGSYGARQASAVVSGPVAENIKARLSVFASEDHGFNYNPTQDTTLGGAREQGGRLTLAYDGGHTQIKFYLSGDKLRSQNENLYYAPEDDRSYSLQVKSNVRPSYLRTLYSPSLSINHDFDNGLKLTSITSYFLSDSSSRTDGDHRAVPIFDVFQTLNTHVVTQEVRLTSAPDAPLKWIVGAYGQRLGQYFEQRNFFDLSVITGDPADVGVEHSRTRHTQEQVALFGDATYSLNQMDLELGLRAQHYRNTLHNLLDGTLARTSDTVFLPKGSLTYHVTDAILAYGSIAAGIQPADNIAENAGISSYKAEKTLNYELGFKSTLFSRRLRFNADVFYIDYRNRLFSTIDGSTLIGITRNIGPSYNYGLELEATFRATPELTLTSGLGLTKALWKHALIFDPTVGAVVDLDGKSAPYTPEYQANLGATWRHALTDTLSLDARVGASFFGRQWWDVTDHYQQRPYALVNLGVSLEGRKWSLSVDAKNLFDERYNTIFAAAEQIGAPFNTGSIGRPREVFVALSVKY